MFHLVYCSTAARLFTPEGLDGLLTQSRERNARDEITGLLLYHEGGFVQALEGSESNVQTVFASIRRDPRHHSVVTILMEGVAEREFADWHMAFRRIHGREDVP